MAQAPFRWGTSRSPQNTLTSSTPMTIHFSSCSSLFSLSGAEESSHKICLNGKYLGYHHYFSIVELFSLQLCPVSHDKICKYQSRRWTRRWQNFGMFVWTDRSNFFVLSQALASRSNFRHYISSTLVSRERQDKEDGLTTYFSYY